MTTPTADTPKIPQVLDHMERTLRAAIAQLNAAQADAATLNTAVQCLGLIQQEQYALKSYQSEPVIP